MYTRHLVTAAAALVLCGAAHATERGRFAEQASLASGFSMSLEHASGSNAPAQQADTAVALNDDHLSAVEFGAAGSWRWTVQTGFGLDMQTSENNIALGGVGASYFLIENLSFNVELNAAYAAQIGPEAGGVNFNVLLRWHFADFGRFTIFADGGAGMIFTTKDVPSAGSSVNFTPQLGVGMSYAINERMQLLAGVRWHHISNANLYRENPGRDSILVHAAISLPF